MEHNVLKFAVYLMKSVSDFAGRMAPMPYKTPPLTSPQVAIVMVSTLLPRRDQYLRSSAIQDAASRVSAQNLLGQAPLQLVAA